MKVLLYLKRKEQDKSGLCPLMGKITIKGGDSSTAQLSCKLKINSEIWNATSQRCTGKSRVAVKTNKDIESLLLLLRQRYDELYDKGASFTATDIKNALQGIATAQDTMLGVYGDFNKQYALRVGVNRAKGTYAQYSNTFRLVDKFINAKYKVSDVPVRSLDLLFIENFCNFLRIDERKQPKTVTGHITRLKTIGISIVHRGLLGTSPFNGFTPPKAERKQRYLSKEELERIMNTTFDSPNRNFTRDMFIFSTFTGVSYCDMCNLTESNIKQDDSGKWWLITTRQKTGTPENVLLLDVAIELIEKYRGETLDGKLFPMMRNLVLNKHLKEIAKECGIDRNLTYHQSRHTFASVVCISQGVPIESVSRAMGHKNISTTQHYAKVTNEKISQDVDAFSSAISGKFSLSGIDAPVSNLRGKYKSKKEI